jgi:ketosteroid isomerase-like protein
MQAGPMRLTGPIRTTQLEWTGCFDLQSGMRSIPSMLSLWALLAANPAAQAADKVSPAEREEFKTMAYKLWTGWDSLDPSKVAGFYSKDPNNVYFDISPLKFKGWSEYAEVAGKNLAGAQGAKWSPNGDDFNLIKSGDLAVTSLTMNVLFTNKTGVSTKMQVRDTDVWEKQGGKWLIIHEHVSVPSGGAAISAQPKGEK